MATFNARDAALRYMSPEIREQYQRDQAAQQQQTEPQAKPDGKAMQDNPSKLTELQQKNREAVGPDALQKIERGINEEEKADREKLDELSANPALHPMMSMSPGGFDVDRLDDHARALSDLQDHERGMAERGQQRQETREKYGLVAPDEAAKVAPAAAQEKQAEVQPGGVNEKQTRQLAQDAHEQKMLTTLSQQAEPQAQSAPADAAKAKREPIPRPTREDGKKHGHELV